MGNTKETIIAFMKLELMLKTNSDLTTILIKENQTDIKFKGDRFSFPDVKSAIEFVLNI